MNARGKEHAMLLGAAVLMLIMGSLYSIQPKKKRLRALLLKGGTTCIAFLLALYGAIQTGKPAVWLICIATFCCMTADVLLELNFTLGAAVFGAGHLFYMAAYLGQVKITPLWGVLIVAFTAGMYLCHCRKSPIREAGLPAFLYGVVLSAMTATALLRALQNQDSGSLLTAVGAVFFFASDNLLIGRLRTQNQSVVLDRLILVLYYAAVYLIAAGSLWGSVL